MITGITYCKIGSSRPVQYSILDHFIKKCHITNMYISIKITLQKQSENWKCATNRDSLLLATLWQVTVCNSCILEIPKDPQIKSMYKLANLLSQQALYPQLKKYKLLVIMVRVQYLRIDLAQDHFCFVCKGPNYQTFALSFYSLKILLIGSVCISFQGLVCLRSLIFKTDANEVY